MYESFFRFTSRPFVAAPLVANYFAAEPIESARQTLTRSIDRAEGPGLIVGPTGSGKTLLCRVLADRFQETFQVAMLSSTRILTRKALLQNILFELGQQYRGLEEGELRLSLLDYLQPNDDCPNGILLIIDEAHSLPLRLLEEVRMITNLVRDGQPRVRLVMAGSPKLEEKFASPKLESFNQRIAARCYLEPFNREETADYVLSRLSVAGGNADGIFTDDALRAVYQATDGIPRLINQVCDHSLVMAFAGGRQQIDAAGIEEAWADLQQLPGPWQDTGVGDFADDESSDTTIEFGELDGETTTADPEPVVIEPSYEVEATYETVEVQSLDLGYGPMESPIQEALAAQEAQQTEPEPTVSVVDPFGHDFDEEEVVIDQHSIQSTEIFANRTRVSSDEGRELLASVVPVEESSEASDSKAETIGTIEVVREPQADEETISGFDEPAEATSTPAEESFASVPVSIEAKDESPAPAIAEAASGAEMFQYTAFEPNDAADLALETLCDVNVALNDLQAECQGPAESPVEEPTVKLMEHLPVAIDETPVESDKAGSRGDSQDDRSIIVVENDATPNPTGEPEGSVHRVEYQTLFTQLRQG